MSDRWCQSTKTLILLHRDQPGNGDPRNRTANTGSSAFLRGDAEKVRPLNSVRVSAVINSQKVLLRVRSLPRPSRALRPVVEVVRKHASLELLWQDACVLLQNLAQGRSVRVLVTSDTPVVHALHRPSRDCLNHKHVLRIQDHIMTGSQGNPHMSAKLAENCHLRKKKRNKKKEVE